MQEFKLQPVVRETKAVKTTGSQSSETVTTAKVLGHSNPNNWPCKFRGEVIDKIPCATCGTGPDGKAKTKLFVYSCEKHQKCCLSKALSESDTSLKYCLGCADRAE